MKEGKEDKRGKEEEGKDRAGEKEDKTEEEKG